jgi:ABC-2 type transport system ATP-binding protein
MHTYAINIHNLSKIYPGGVKALQGISLDIKAGSFFGLLGPNGAGKSTTIGIITSLVNKSSGSVEVFGTNIDKDFSTAKAFFGVVPQEFNFNIFEKVINIIINQAGYYGIPRQLAKTRAKKYLQILGLWEKRHQQARQLSGGMKRRLMIARALVHEPKLLILDEPTAGVDIELRRSMWLLLQELNAQGITIILTTHYLEEAESLCQDIAIINHGKIIEHTSVKNLINQLDLETFIFDLKYPMLTNFNCADIIYRQIDAHTLEVDIPKSQSLNQLFTYFAEHNIEVTSMRNKVNRLEELFVRLTSRTTGTSHADQ